MTDLDRNVEYDPWLTHAVGLKNKRRRELCEKYQNTRKLKITSDEKEFVAIGKRWQVPISAEPMGYVIREVDEPTDYGYGYFDDPNLGFEREEASHAWFYAERAKAERGEPSMVRIVGNVTYLLEQPEVTQETPQAKNKLQPDREQLKIFFGELFKYATSLLGGVPDLKNQSLKIKGF